MCLIEHLIVAVVLLKNGHFEIRVNRYFHFVIVLFVSNIYPMLSSLTHQEYLVSNKIICYTLHVVNFVKIVKFIHIISLIMNVN